MKHLKMRRFLLICAFAMHSSFAQIGLGGSISLAQLPGEVSGADFRLTPFLYGGIPVIGAVRLEWAPSSLTRTGEKQDDAVRINRYGIRYFYQNEVVFRNSYPLLSWNRIQVSDDGPAGDAEWDEFGLGYGVMWLVGGSGVLFFEVEHIWSAFEKEYTTDDVIEIDRRGWQVQLGFVAIFGL